MINPTLTIALEVNAKKRESEDYTLSAGVLSVGD